MRIDWASRRTTIETLGVRLEVDEAIDHLHARALEIARPADVGLLVEACLELDQRGHGLPASAAAISSFTMGESADVR